MKKEPVQVAQTEQELRRKMSSIQFLSDTLTDIEKTRIGLKNRIQYVMECKPAIDKATKKPKTNGEMWGLGWGNNPAGPPIEVQPLLTLRASIDADEKRLIKDLEKLIAEHPSYDAIKDVPGIGAKTIGRLLGAIGDPYIRTNKDGTSSPRTLSQLQSYTGYSVVDGHAQRLQAKTQANWSSEARMRLYLVSASCVKQKGKQSKYRDIYDEERAIQADAVHMVECARCTGKGKPPAAVGTPLKLGHQHARAMRMVSKQILRDLYDASRAWHANLETAPTGNR